MSVNVTSFRFSQNLRYVGLGLAVVGLLALVVVGLVDSVRVQLAPLPVLGSCVVAAVASFSGVCLALEQRPSTVPFRTLDVERRLGALRLAWRERPSADLRPYKMLGGSVLAAVILVGIVPATSHGGVGIGLALLGAVVPAGVAFGRDRFVVLPLQVKVGLRHAAVTFVNEHADEWRATAGSKCEALGLDRFKLHEPTKRSYALPWYDVASAVASDMPPRQTDFTVLAVGEFVGFHSGYVIDMKGISEAHASETDPDVVVPDQVKVLIDEERVREREAHYRDIVNIDYTSPEGTNGAPVGVLALGLSNGEKIEYPTLKAGSPWKSALENIRKRTRDAKLGEARAQF